ncbi:MAG: FAD-dependent oxidoreductase [Planctomycetota bacterium]
MIRVALALTLGILGSLGAAAQDVLRADVVVYGGTSAGVIAAIQADRMGREVLLIEPGSHLGGLSSGGLGATDIGNKAAIGGLAREFYRRIRAHYSRDEAWRFQRRDEYRSSRLSAEDDAMWTFEPSVAEATFETMLAETGVRVLRGERLDRPRGVGLREARIIELGLVSGRRVRGETFIDASYEGDLLAEAGVPYRVGRESNAAFGETLNGVQLSRARFHQFRFPVSPYRIAGDPASGLLPGIEPGAPEPDGTGDDRVQAYCFRMCLTDDPRNRIPVAKPEGYDPVDHELLFRHFEAGFDALPWHAIAMPNRKTDVNNNHAVSLDQIGLAATWAEASDAERAALLAEHRRRQQGLVWALAHETRVPEAIRREAARWGLCRDEFRDTDGWGHQLYVREGRRMRGRLVMTEAHCLGRRIAPDAVGLAAYTMDSHHVRRVVIGDTVANEGDVQVGGFPPYPIGLDALLPLARHARNLVVPVALSATHIAYGSIRMEPVFMVLGQSAATVAVAALDEGVDVQAVDRRRLRARLLADGQRLAWTPPPPEIDPRSFEGVVVDDEEAEFEGAWTESRSTRPFVGRGYRHDGARETAGALARFRPRSLPAGRHAVRIAYSAHANRAPAARIEILHAGGRTELRLDQRARPTVDGVWTELGTFDFAGDGRDAVLVHGAEGAGHVIADAVWFRPAR